MSIWSPGYRNSHRAVGAKITTDDYEKFAEIARRKGIAPATLNKQLILAEIEKQELETA